MQNNQLKHVLENSIYSDLDDKEKILYSYLFAIRDFYTDEIAISQEKLASILNVSIPTVRKKIDKLVKVGLIDKIKTYNRESGNNYYVYELISSYEYYVDSILAERQLAKQKKQVTMI